MSHLFRVKLISINDHYFLYPLCKPGIVKEHCVYRFAFCIFVDILPINPGVNSWVSGGTPIAIADNPNLREGLQIFIRGRSHE